MQMEFMPATRQEARNVLTVNSILHFVAYECFLSTWLIHLVGTLTNPVSMLLCGYPLILRFQ